MTHRKKSDRAEELATTMNCARWIVRQFETLECPAIARVFQRAVDDADVWIQAKAFDGSLPRESADPIRAKEAAMIHGLLVKYASIEDPVARRSILGGMSTLLEGGRPADKRLGRS